MTKPNIITPFIIEDLNIRGRIAQLNASIDDIICRHNYPEEVSHLVAQITILASLLGSNLKNQERFSIQIRSTGSVKLLICDFTAPNKIRSYAKFIENELKTKKLLDEGTLTFTINKPGTTPLYQAIVPLKGDSIAEIAQNYYEKSEQIPTDIKINSAIIIDHNLNKKSYRAGGILIKKLTTKNNNPDHWNEAKILTETITAEELLKHDEVSAHKLLFRLFHNYDIKVFEPIEIIDKCNCSQKTIEEMLQNFAPEDLEQSDIEITCQFCSKIYKL